MGKKRSRKESEEKLKLFEAEAAYGESVFSQIIGDMQASIEAVERACEIKPDYPPAILTKDGRFRYPVKHA